MNLSPALFFLLLGLALLGVELIIMQFSVFWFLFLGLGALITAGVGWMFPQLSWAVNIAVFLVSSLVVWAALYRPLSRWQKQPGAMPGNDALGQTASVLEAITADNGGKVHWSGSEWPAELDAGEAPFDVGEKAVIRRLEGIRLIVGR